MKVSCFAALFALGALVAACDSTPRDALDGTTWTRALGVNGLLLQRSFAEGRYSFSRSIAEPLEPLALQLVVHHQIERGTYSLTDDTLTMHPEEGTCPGERADLVEKVSFRGGYLWLTPPAPEQELMFTRSAGKVTYVNRVVVREDYGCVSMDGTFRAGP